MLTVILAGGKGTRILEETRFRPKAMVEIGNRPIIQHIMDCYQKQGYKDFLILTGYMSQIILEYFQNREDVVSWESDGRSVLFRFPEITVRLLDTGEDTGSAARLRFAEAYIKEERFMLTYCDGLSSVDLNELLSFHEAKNRLVTLTAVRPEPRFGIVKIGVDGKVISMREKSREDAPVINGGFMVMERAVFQYITEEMDHLEQDMLQSLVESEQVSAYYHDGFWQSMDTLQEKKYLCSLWDEGNVLWDVKRER